MVKIEHLIAGLREIPDVSFTCDEVYQYLADNPLEVDSITHYFFWSPDFYTRNLIYRDDRFEMLAICWERGQASTIHDHAGQKCWMTVPVGRLRGQNFAVEEMDPSRSYCRLRETNSFELSDCMAAKVELEEPIHQILNLAEYDERAVSIHIYSRPYSSCLSFCPDTHTFKEVQLGYASIDGKLCTA
ncbi:MAG: cysteine dioxygenase family protein [Chloracidobacterium sp.]|nr:cysteine dioxygenase family protein [Chloracidobacterium sp.]